MSPIDGTEIRCQEIGVFGQDSVSLTQTATGFTGDAGGPKRNIYLLLGQEWTSGVMLTISGKRGQSTPPMASSPSNCRCEFTIEKP